MNGTGTEMGTPQELADLLRTMMNLVLNVFDDKVGLYKTEVSDRQMEINALELRGEVTFGSQQRFLFPVCHALC